MSDMLDHIFKRNFLNLSLDDAFLPLQPQPKAPGPRLNRSTSFFSSPSPPSPSASSSHHSLSVEHVNHDDDDDGGSAWPSDIWSKAAPSKPQHLLFRPDRSMSLTESSSALLLSSFGHLKGLEPSSGTTVAPPPGFPPLSSLQTQSPVSLPSNRYKTELCRGFQESGSCKYGSKCQFAHGEAELRGLYRHPKYKTEPCRTFYNFGYCPYGTRCHFIHEEKAAGGPLSSAKHQSQRQTAPANATAGGQNIRHQLRQSVSFAGFLGSSRNSPPPPSSSAFNDPNLGFSRTPSISPPPADLLSPVFGDTLQREAATFQFDPHRHRTQARAGDILNIPLIVEPKSSRCTCSHGNSLPTSLNTNNNNRVFGRTEDEQPPDASGLFLGRRGGLIKAPALQRFSSEDSLEDSYSSSSGGSSGTESPTFDGSAGKRLTVFARLSLSD